MAISLGSHHSLFPEEDVVVDGSLRDACGFTPFGTNHVAILCAVPILATALSFAHRRLPAERNFIRLGFAANLLVDIAVYYGWQFRHHSLTFPDHALRTLRCADGPYRT